MTDPSSPQAKPNYRILARKYRPVDFSGLIGQEAMVQTLANAIGAGRLAQAYILTGVRGVGKTTTARIIARALNCVGPGGDADYGPTSDPCGVCEHCRAIIRRQPHGRDRDGRRQPHRRRGHSRAHRGCSLPADLGALQGLHHRRGPHAVAPRFQRAAEDPGGAARAREVYLRHHRDPQGPGDRSQPLPALRPEKGGQRDPCQTLPARGRHRRRPHRRRTPST